MRCAFGLTRAPARLVFGAGQRHGLAAALKGLGQRVLICTDSRFAALPEMAEITTSLETAGFILRLFAETEPELPRANVEACAARFAAFDPEVIIGLGGGSCMDLAKLVSLLLTHGGPLPRFYGEMQVPGPIRPVIAIPTTAGTGSEVTPVAVIGDPERAMKVGISSPELIPHTAVCDPELTLTCPPGLTAVSGADALAHALEAFCAIRRPPEPDLAYGRVFVGKNVLSDHYARAAMTLLFEWLPKAVAEGGDLDARSAVMQAATLAGLAFATAGTAVAHAVQYPVGALTHTAHGLGVGVLLPYAMDFNAEGAPDLYAEVAQHLGVGTRAADAVAAVRALFATIGIPASLAEIGMTEDRIAWAAESAMQAKRLVDNNPVTLDAQAIERLIRAAMDPAHAP